MNILTDNELEALKQWAADNSKTVNLSSGVSGTVTCDGYAVEVFDDKLGLWGVYHPKTVINTLLKDVQ